MNQPLPIPPLKDTINRQVVRALQRTNGNVKKAADILQIPKSTLHDRIRRYNLKEQL